MKVETKYNVGDRLIALSNEGKAMEIEVCDIMVTVKADQTVSVYYRKEGEESSQCPTSGHEPFGTVELFLFYVQVFFNPIHASQRAYPVIQHAAEGVADCAVGNEQPRVEPCGHERKHDDLAA